MTQNATPPIGVHRNWTYLPLSKKKARVASCDSELSLSRRWLHCQFNPGSKCFSQSPSLRVPSCQSGGAAILSIMIPDRAHLSSCALFSDASLPQVVLQVQINNPRFKATTLSSMTVVTHRVPLEV
jgi:hypothetical protein